MPGLFHALPCALAAAACSAPAGTLELVVADAGTGAPTPARLELVDAEGRAHVPPSALPVRTECFFAPLPEWASRVQEALSESSGIDNAATGTRQFYLAEPASWRLPAGRYRLRAFKGLEYRADERDFEIRAGETTRTRVALSRWIDLPARGWYGADDHIHLTRRSPDEDAWIGRWMRAEDLHVANLLQMGTARQFGVTPQYAFGDEGTVALDETLLIPGQEHPRTNVFGHTIVLGADAAIDLRDRYASYQRFWSAARQRGGLAGFAHWGLGAARDGLALDAPSGWIHFVEVLQFEHPHYDVWYELLDLGLRVTPTAGTDFPCGPWGVPGRERFYTRVEGPLSRHSWLDGIRRGRTFVTNGPLLELRLGGAGAGDELVLDAPREIPVLAVARFDPERDDVQRLELLRDGEPVVTATEPSEPGTLRIDTTLAIREAGWYALRASGDKRGETPLEPMGVPEILIAVGQRIANGAEMDTREAFARRRALRPSAAHTAPVYVAVAGRPGLAERPRARALARAWLARLDAIEERFTEERLGELTLWPLQYSDGIPEATLRRSRPEVLRAVAAARTQLERIAGE